ncbi:MAG: DUF4258 domain-containing protein [Gemmatales bacterium]
MDDIPLHPIDNEDLIKKLPYKLKGKFTQVNFTGHARIRMVERNITEEEVMDALENPHGQHPLPDQPTRTRDYISQRYDEVHVVWEPELGYSYRLAVITVIRKQKKPMIRRKRK